VLEKFDFDNTISKLDEAGLLFQVLERFKNVELHPDKVDNPTMGTIFEELIRKFNEALNENPGEHFTPRDVVHLMVDLMLAGDEREIRAKKAIRTVYDPCCGSGGMLMITKEHITVGLRKNGDLLRHAINKEAEIHLFGQVGLVGYEINFNRYFYRYTPPRPLEEIEGEIRGIEQDILRMLAEVTGGPA